GNLPGYHRVSLQRVTIRGTSGALWVFTWLTPGGVTMRVDDLLFEVHTAAGPQSYAIDFTSPAPDFGNSGALPMFNRILRTFQPVTG
ncbi:MAG: hypothetical protein J2P28_20935, partial [Actinobacteria bacterium]|nr:hypothetical protein [Actinomycetota bacterium]